jgi:hypothetical protein
MCGDKVFPHYCYHTNHTKPIALLNSAPFTHMIKVSINITYRHATAILHDTFFNIRKFTSTLGVRLLVAVISIFTICYHENFSVLVSKGKD